MTTWAATLWRMGIVPTGFPKTPCGYGGRRDNGGWDADGLMAAVNDGSADTIMIAEDITLDNPLSITRDVTIDGMGSTEITGMPISVSADVTFQNVTLAKPTNNNNNASLVYGSDGCSTLVFDGCTFSDPQWEAIQITSADFERLTVNNCTFTAANVEGAANGSYGNAADEAIRYIHIEPSAVVMWLPTSLSRTMYSGTAIR